VLQLIGVVLGQVVGHSALAAEGAIALGTGELEHLVDLGDLVVHRLDVGGQVVLRVERLLANGAANGDTILLNRKDGLYLGAHSRK